MASPLRFQLARGLTTSNFVMALIMFGGLTACEAAVRGESNSPHAHTPPRSLAEEGATGPYPADGRSIDTQLATVARVQTELATGATSVVVPAGGWNDELGRTVSGPALVPTPPPRRTTVVPVEGQIEQAP